MNFELFLVRKWWGLRGEGWGIVVGERKGEICVSEVREGLVRGRAGVGVR